MNAMETESALAFGLAAAGVPLIALPDARGPASWPEPSALAAALLGRDDPLFAAAVVPLLVFNPAAAAGAPGAARALSGSRKRAFEHLYTAAAAMRARWRTRLVRVGATHEIPDVYSGGLGLPPAGEGFGDACLEALADRFAGGDGGVVIRGARSMFDHLMRQAFEIAEREAAVAPAG